MENNFQEKTVSTEASHQATRAEDEPAQKTPAVLETATEAVHRVVDKVADAAAVPGAWVNEKREALQAVQNDTLKSAREFVTTNPWRSIVFAFCTGLLLGRLAHRPPALAE